MPAVDIKQVISDPELRDSLVLYRTMEHWCRDNVYQDRWRLDWSGTVCVYGVDLPRRIIFDRLEDLGLFNREFNH